MRFLLLLQLIVLSTLSTSQNSARLEFTKRTIGYSGVEQTIPFHLTASVYIRIKRLWRVPQVRQTLVLISIHNTANNGRNLNKH
jgi:hypothetical protein